jgi:glycosyltransferase involved in cell wall biosynthesis
MDHVVSAKNVEIVGIGPHAAVPVRSFLPFVFTAAARRHAARLDILLLRGPTPLLAPMAHAVRPTSVALLLVGDYLEGIDELPQPLWRKELIRLWSYWNKRQQLGVARRALTLVNSRKLFRELEGRVPRLVETRTTTLTDSDFFEREDTCLGRPLRLLYTGRLDRAKGLFDIIEAVADLVASGEDVVLEFAGWAEEKDSILAEMAGLASKLGLGDRVRYLDFKRLGPELFDCYKQADAYVIASRSSEGFPRTVWEAMAHSLPVVATRVGSIPEFLVDKRTALLAEAKSPTDLANKLRMVFGDSALRRRLIRGGREEARHNTLGRRSREIVQAIEEYVRAC